MIFLSGILLEQKKVLKVQKYWTYSENYYLLYLRTFKFDIPKCCCLDVEDGP